MKIEKLTDTQNTTNITCPYCGWEDKNSRECGLSDKDSDIVACPNCDKYFRVRCFVSVLRSYSSKKINQNIKDGTCIYAPDKE